MTEMDPNEEPFSTQDIPELVEEESDEQLTEEGEQYAPGPRITFSMPAIGRFLGRCCINLVLPFINGMMMGFGELVAHEIGFAWGMSGARVRRKRVAPGVEEVYEDETQPDGQRRLLLQS
ncbi:outer membrane protein TOM13-domain-containing protein [Yarrowia lipolytica]|uniref:Outer membrane protein TOM13-domain-containing protein n=1 Tax=Yarrowia lipolytica TaxID=4952 RepID=A0A371C957_YARLL|nr:outer membrane protein TOM13-domain-containing protein [Yarrowia lipolytica]RDW33133.1 outer membrane protein TOM13-domain-containing protein [Yarrowia lipolytica]RDW41112.1 outer membrane protein TOM13-domain-containing protein [Yarrowia lipolytica]RDW48816.1 outer membrane protein TOM13-domain-containing protein [Yarrowia lipolytica]RDW55396.1 outer membrane protein TOM13-domain-containing protein [Yarrowia lipolytica]